MEKEVTKLEEQKDKYENGQGAKLTEISKSVKRSVVIGAILLVILFVSQTLVGLVESERLETTMALNQYRIGSKALTTAVQSYAVTGNTQYYDDYHEELEVTKNRDTALAILEKNDIKDDEWEKMNQLASLSNELVPLEENAMESVKQGNTEEAIDFVFGIEYATTIEKINILTEETISQVQNRLANKKKIIQVVEYGVEILFLLSFIYIAIQVINTIKFARMELLLPIKKVSEQMLILAQGDMHSNFDMQEDESEVGDMVASIHFMRENISNMITEITEVLGMMGEGNYNVSIEKEYIGDFVKIRNSMLLIKDAMRETFTTLREVSSQIDSGSEQLACAAQDLAEGCTSQAMQVSELASTVRGMSSITEKNAVESDESKRMSETAAGALVLGNEKMQELKAAIGEIGDCSEQISSIINTIEQIASETNLLSLNASIEAARAGEAGKGFAVVADQVKKLSEESSVAAGETAKLIGATIRAVERGINIANETVEKMDEVMVGASASTEKMVAIGELLHQEVEEMQNLDTNISRVSSIVDSNSATAEETAAISEQQKAQVETLVDLMSRFQI